MGVSSPPNPPIDPPIKATLDAAFETAIQHHQSGRAREAATLYRQILEIDADHADSLHLLGLLAHQEGRGDEALRLIGRAIEIDPDAAPFRNSLGNLHHAQGNLAAAAEQYRLALERRPESAEIASNLGTVLREMGDLPGAIASYRLAHDHAPGSSQILYNLANALAANGNNRSAETCYSACIERDPTHADALYNFGNLLISLRRWQEAEAIYRQALAVRPDHAETLNNLGTVLQELGFPDRAERCYRKALALRSDYADPHYNLGCLRQVDGRLDEAAACYQRALEIDPAYGEARVALCMAQLPLIYHDEAEVPARRALYEEALNRLAQDAGTTISLERLADGVGANQPFLLAYQGFNDRPLQKIYGELVCGVMAARYPERPQSPPGGRAKLRIGIVSGFFQDHTVWKLFIEGWITQFDRDRFEVFGYHTGMAEDADTAIAAERCDKFTSGGRKTDEWRRLILGDQPDALLYPDIGMDPMSARLGAMRLAPLQCVTWGHPETTGFPTIDAFLSNALMEPPDGRNHYTENLVLLPNLSTYYVPYPHPVAPADRAELGLRTTATIFWSGQAIYKYHPQFDWVYPAIALAAGDCQFVFIEFAKSRAVTDVLRDRLDKAFAAVGLQAEDYCVFLKPMDQAGFLAAVGQADVLLDTLGWSGGRSTLDCLTQDPVIVTLEDGLMRGRHTAAILRRMELTETIAHSLDEYVEKAVWLARDPAAREAIRAQVAVNKERVFHDRAYIEALEDFLEQRIRPTAETAHAPLAG